MAFILRTTLMCMLFIASLLCSFHSCLASRLFPESKDSSATELGLDSSSFFQPSLQALPTLQNHMLIPNPNPALPTFQDHMPFPNPNSDLPPTFKDNMWMPNPNPAFTFPGLPALPKLPPIPLIPKVPIIRTVPLHNPYFHAIPPIPSPAKQSADLAVSTNNEPIITTP